MNKGIHLDLDTWRVPGQILGKPPLIMVSCHSLGPGGVCVPQVNISTRIALPTSFGTSGLEVMVLAEQANDHRVWPGVWRGHMVGHKRAGPGEAFN